MCQEVELLWRTKFYWQWTSSCTWLLFNPFQERPHLPQQLVFLNVVGLRGWYNLPSNISSSFWTTKIDWQWTSSCTWLLFKPFQERPHLPQQLVFLNVVGLRGWYNLPSNISKQFLNNQDRLTMNKFLYLAIVQPFQERPHLPQQLVFLNVVVYGAGITFLQISQAVFEQPRSTDNEQVLVLGYCSTISRKASSSTTIGLFERGWSTGLG